MKLIRSVNRKAMTIRYSGRSSDFITPTFGHGCLYKCSYCYMRRHIPNGISIAKNTEEIIFEINKHIESQKFPKCPNQTHDYFYTYDFSCNEDYILHAKYHNWEYLFDFFKNNPKAMGTAATKYVNNNLLKYNANRKIRIRFSLMPQRISSIYEPKTSSILERIMAINKFYEAGYDVHVNYSPVIAYKEHTEDYRELFSLVDKYVHDDIKPFVKAEVIFLTHNEGMHKYNEINNVKGENVLWFPKWQEPKTSSYGGKNVRYKKDLKPKFIQHFKDNLNEIAPWQEIRYIF